MLAQLAAVHESIEAEGGAVIGIAPAAAYQAEHLMETSIPFDLYIDRELLVSERIGIGRQSLSGFLFNMPAWWRYVKALATNLRQGRITGHYSNLPGIAVVDASGEVTYAYRGTGLGDYPSLEIVIGELRSETDKLNRG
jgi:hypothetical protein